MASLGRALSYTVCVTTPTGMLLRRLADMPVLLHRSQSSIVANTTAPPPLPLGPRDPALDKWLSPPEGPQGIAQQGLQPEQAFLGAAIARPSASTCNSAKPEAFRIARMKLRGPPRAPSTFASMERTLRLGVAGRRPYSCLGYCPIRYDTIR